MKNLIGNMSTKFGAYNNPLDEKKEKTLYGSDRYQFSKNLDDLLIFRLPSLRNVDVSVPNFHDGSKQKLPNEIELMAKAKVDIITPRNEAALIAPFLNRVTGRYQGMKL